ncbi:MAG TPA: hypothetical protein VMV69_29555 [Pirellulales bacterium]|nr:hypothetical protein [Pirellulales bacterium]
MAGDESIRDDASRAERSKITKSSTEYRKTESESHEIERAGDHEKRVVSSETRETSVERSESVEIRRAAATLPAPAAPAANWHASMPATVRLSISGAQPETCSDAALFDGDYILDLVDAHADACRWEVSFDAHCRLYRAALTAVPGSGRFELRAELQGAVPGPRWSADAPPGFDQTLTLRLDPFHAVAAGCRWPETVTVMPLHAAPAQGRYDISPQATAAERAAMAAIVTSGSSGGGGPDPTTGCNCVCPCGCAAGGTMTPNSAPSRPCPTARCTSTPTAWGRCATETARFAWP